MIYAIRRETEDKTPWLAGWIRFHDDAPTCIWADRIQRARIFNKLKDAQWMANTIGGCRVVEIIENGEAFT